MPGETVFEEALTQHKEPRGRGYSDDFRLLVYTSEGTFNEQAARAGVHQSTVQRWHKRLLTTGTLSRSPCRGGRPVETTEDEDNYMRLVTCWTR